MKRPLTQASGSPAHQRILYVSEAAIFCGCSEKSLRRRVERQLVPFRRWNGRICFLRSELEEFFTTTLPGVSLAEAKANLALRTGELVRHE